MLVHKLDSFPKILLLLVRIHSIESERVLGLWVLAEVVVDLLHLIVDMLTACKVDS